MSLNTENKSLCQFLSYHARPRPVPSWVDVGVNVVNRRSREEVAKKSMCHEDHKKKSRRSQHLSRFSLDSACYIGLSVIGVTIKPTAAVHGRYIIRPRWHLTGNPCFWILGEVVLQS